MGDLLKVSPQVSGPPVKRPCVDAQSESNVSGPPMVQGDTRRFFSHLADRLLLFAAVLLRAGCPFGNAHARNTRARARLG